MLKSPWQVAENRAALSLSQLAGELCLTQPWQGLHDLQVEGNAFASARLFCLQSNPGTDDESIIDQYTRGEDLVVSYSQTESRPVSLHVYWRASIWAMSLGNVPGVDLIVSRQTDLLDSDPSLQVVSELSSARCVNTGGAAAKMLVRPENQSSSLLLAAHPADCEDIEINSPGDETTRIAFELFRPGLEKGVIRRARLRLAFLPREGDEQLASECYASLATAPPPLTT